MEFDLLITQKRESDHFIKPLEFESDKAKQNASDSALVLVIMIGTLLPACRYPDSKMMALKMLTAIGKQINEELRLQYIVPYCISCFNDSVSKVRLAAIDGVVESLKDTESVEIGHTDYFVFDTYIFPAFSKLLDDGDPIIQLKFIETLPHLINIGKMLIASVNSHMQQITMLAKDEQFEIELSPEQRDSLLFGNFLFEEKLDR